MRKLSLRTKPLQLKLGTVVRTSKFLERKKSSKSDKLYTFFSCFWLLLAFMSLHLHYEGCSFSDICRSVKQEVALWFTCNIHIPSKYSPLLCTHSSCHLRQDSEDFDRLRRCVELWIYCFCQVQNVGKFQLSRRGEQLKVTWSQVWTVGRMGQTWRFRFFRKVTVTLAFWALALSRSRRVLPVPTVGHCRFIDFMNPSGTVSA